MAAIDLTYRATLYDLVNRTEQQVLLVGQGSLTGLSVGGGPVIPPTSPGVPTHPIMLPGMPGWGDPHPAHPIELPKPPTEPPTDTVPGGDKPPGPQGGWGYVAQWSDGSPGGWGLFPSPGQAGPKTGG